jgi:CrcB protein
MFKLFIIGCGGFVGAIARYGISGWVQNWSGERFPAGTLAVNVLGCFLLGALMALVHERQQVGDSMRAFVGVGLLGAFTTFSTFGHETVELLQDARWWLGGAYVAGNVVIGLAAVLLGRVVMLWAVTP